MSIETLRRAASLMRERAGAAADRTDVPWAVVESEGSNRDQRRTLGQFSLVHDNVAEVAIVRGFTDERQPVAEHIASWHPAVALAVADWLDTAGADLWAHGPLCCESEHGCDECDGILWMQHVRRALVVARAYLRESA